MFPWELQNPPFVTISPSALGLLGFSVRGNSGIEYVIKNRIIHETP